MSHWRNFFMVNVLSSLLVWQRKKWQFTHVIESTIIYSSNAQNYIQKDIITSTISPVTFRISSISETAAASPQRWSSSAAIPSNALVKENPLVLHPNIWKKDLKFVGQCLDWKKQHERYVLNSWVHHHKLSEVSTSI